MQKNSPIGVKKPESGEKDKKPEGTFPPNMQGFSQGAQNPMMMFPSQQHSGMMFMGQKDKNEQGDKQPMNASNQMAAMMNYQAMMGNGLTSEMMQQMGGNGMSPALLQNMAMMQAQNPNTSGQGQSSQGQGQGMPQMNPMAIQANNPMQQPNPMQQGGNPMQSNL